MHRNVTLCFTVLILAALGGMLAPAAGGAAQVDIGRIYQAEQAFEKVAPLAAGRSYAEALARANLPEGAIAALGVTSDVVVAANRSAPEPSTTSFMRQIFLRESSRPMVNRSRITPISATISTSWIPLIRWKP